MRENTSPWIHQLERTREPLSLSEDLTADAVIVGGGIAGLMTAYYILTTTSQNVLLLEADKVAHGATGHNAGQITSYFERPFTSLVEEFGLDRASEGQRSVESAWALLDEIVLAANLTTPVYRFTGYAGCATIEQLLVHLENNRLRIEGGLPAEAITVAEGWGGMVGIPQEYSSLYSTAPHDDILALLNTQNSSYIASIAYQKGCTNSARLTEELAGYLLKTHPDRFQLFEGTFVTTVRARKDDVLLTVGEHTVTGTNIILCTNGFEHFTLENETGEPIDKSFHHSVDGRIGYMVGYIEGMNSAPTAISYFSPPQSPNADPTGETYFYLTRRPHESADGQAQNLVCAGGPEAVLPNLAVYSRTNACREDMQLALDDFLRTNYRHYPESELEYAFCWHGLMGYTPNGIRRVGREPKNTNLLYNLGCNGVGILPSIYGAKRIAQLLGGEELPPSIFDPS